MTSLRPDDLPTSITTINAAWLKNESLAIKRLNSFMELALQLDWEKENVF